MEELWQLWVDTGGTFTDALAVDPQGVTRQVKVLSSSALRARLTHAVPERVPAEELSYWVGFVAAPAMPEHFAVGARLSLLDGSYFEAEVLASTPSALRLSSPCPAAAGTAFELRFAEEAPVLAARLLTLAAKLADLPPMRVRLATTRGTNALLERKGARTAFFVTRGFGDLLVIGNQQRPELFALEIVRPEPLYSWVVEVPERLAAGGEVFLPLDLTALEPTIDRLLAEGCEAAAVALLHSYANPEHEQKLGEYLRRKGLAFVSTSAALSPTIEILPRAQTAVVDAYLSPLIDRYFERVGVLASARLSSLHVMTSAGGLLPPGSLRAKDTLLSGPAGGVVGAAAAGIEAGFPRLLGFDMGGTSTDVCRVDGDLEYTFEHQVAGARVAAPALRIETVAAGGGSICRLEGAQLKVGPESAGAAPGPACYGAGGPLTLTDVNLLLGRLRPERFTIPIDSGAAEAELAKIVAALPSSSCEDVLLGFLEIANERMAETMRRVSIRQGYDPADHALIAFGGAGGQHACAIAELLGIEVVILPVHAGLLSARGLGAARLERFAQRQVLELLPGRGEALEETLRELAETARQELMQDGLDAEAIEIRRRLVFLRFLGQENALELELESPLVSESALEQSFRARFEGIYGYCPQGRPIEVAALRVVASQRPIPIEVAALLATSGTVYEPSGEQVAFLGGNFRSVPCFDFEGAPAGASFEGPALLFDDSASLVLEPGWRATKSAAGSWVALRR